MIKFDRPTLVARRARPTTSHRAGSALVRSPLPRWARQLVLLTWDALTWVLSLTTAVLFRYDWDPAAVQLAGLTYLCAIVILAQAFVGAARQLYAGRYLIGGAEDALNVGACILLSGSICFGLNLLPHTPFAPRSTPLVACFFALALALAPRILVRRTRERHSKPDKATAQRVVIYGAGVGGQQLVRSMLSDPGGGYLPVALLDDDPEARRRRVSGVPVRGTRADIATVAAVAGAELLVIATRSADRAVVREVAQAAARVQLGVKVVPPMNELLRPWVGVSDLRDLDITDLLGRRPVGIDLGAVADYVTGKRVLVTGAGGSIGSELCRQLKGFRTAELMMLDRDESALHGTQLSISGRALLNSPDVILADIRDAAAVTTIFRERRPDVVFHAAALKHLPMLEQYPEEAWKTNVEGTLNVLGAAREVGVEKFVNISTDKAANPISVLGRSKRIGEMLVADVTGEASCVYLSVRFGNVLGSRGSVLTTFTEQLRSGVPITVTHPDVTRFFMTIPEAVQLVVYAAAIGRPGEVLVLDMGEPVRIADVARQLMDMAGLRSEIVYTGLRDGEKLHEELFGAGEHDVRPVNPLVSHVVVPAVSPERVANAWCTHGTSKALEQLTRPAPPTVAGQHHFLDLRDRLETSS